MSIAAISIHLRRSNTGMWNKTKLGQVICKSHPDVSITEKHSYNPAREPRRENLSGLPLSSFRIRKMQYFPLEPLKN